MSRYQPKGNDMKHFTITNNAKPSHQVIVTEDNGKYHARLYVNNGDTATLTCWNGKTEKGARRFAEKVFGA
jgi:hypothetical protein